MKFNKQGIYLVIDNYKYNKVNILGIRRRKRTKKKKKEIVSFKIFETVER